MPAAVAIPLASAGVGLAGNIIGGGKAAGAQQGATQEAQAQQNQVMQLVQNYLGTVAPQVQQLVSSLSNWNGLKPQELNALTTNAAASGQSDINTARSQGAFGANQNAAIGNELEKNQLASEGAAVNIGSNASQQELGALQSIPSALNLLNPTASGANTLAGLSENNQQTAQGYGNPYGNAANSLGSLLNTVSNSSSGKSTSSATPNLGVNPSTLNMQAPYTAPSTFGVPGGASAGTTGGMTLGGGGPVAPNPLANVTPF